jgi:hypothetical protein
MGSRNKGKSTAIRNLENGINPNSGKDLGRKFPIRYDEGGNDESPINQAFGGTGHLHSGHNGDPVELTGILEL